LSHTVANSTILGKYSLNPVKQFCLTPALPRSRARDRRVCTRKRGVPASWCEALQENGLLSRFPETKTSLCDLRVSARDSFCVFNGVDWLFTIL